MIKTSSVGLDLQRRHIIKAGIVAAGVINVLGMAVPAFAGVSVSANNGSRLTAQQVTQMGVQAPTFTVETPEGGIVTLTRRLVSARQYQGLVYLAYENAPAIHVYDTDSLQHHFDIQFDAKLGVLKDFAVSDNGDIYVLFSGRHAIFHLSSNGSFIQKISEFGINIPAQLNGPHSLTIDSLGNIHVWDAGSRQIKVFTTDNQFVRQYGQARLNPVKGVKSLDGRDPIVVTGGQSGEQKWMFSV